MPIRKKLVDSMLLLGSANLFRTFGGMIRAKVVALLLGTTGIGILALNVRLIGLLWNIGTLCIGTAIIKYVSEYLAKKDDGRVSSLLCSAFWILLASCLLNVALVLFFAKPLSSWLFKDERYWFLIATVGLGVPAYVFGRFFECILNAQKRIAALAISLNIATVLLIGSIYPLVVLFGIEGAVINVVVTYGFGWVFYYWHYRKDPVTRTVHLFDVSSVRLSVLKTIFRFSAFDFARGVVVYASLLLIPVIIVNQLGMRDNGIYQSAWSISFYLTTLFSALMVYYLPRISEVDGEKVPAEINETLEVAIVAMTPLVLATVAFRDLLIPLFYESSFAPASELLRWFMIGKLFEVVNIILLNSFVGRAKLGSMLGFEALRSVVCLAATWAMVLMWAVRGAALGYMVSHALMAGCGAVYLRGKLRIAISRANIALLWKAQLLVTILAVLSYRAWYHYALAIAISLAGMYFLVGWERYRAIVKLYVRRA